MSRTIFPLVLILGFVFFSRGVFSESHGEILIDGDDTAREVREKVVASSKAYFAEPGFALEDVDAFSENIRAAWGREEEKHADPIRRWVGRSVDSYPSLTGEEASSLIRAFRMVYLLGTAQDEAVRELSRIIALYDGEIRGITVKAQRLEGILKQLEDANDSAQELVDSSLGSVRAAREASEALNDVFETYRAIIASQRELLVGLKAPERRHDPVFSLLAGPQWYYGADETLEEFSLAVGSQITWPLFSHWNLGIGVLTTMPPASAGLFLQAGYSR